jgi:hypothetical protein
MIEMMFFVLSFGFMLVYLFSIIYVLFKAKVDDVVEEEFFLQLTEEEVQPTYEVHQKNTYNVKDVYIPKGQQLTPEMFK